MNDKDIGSFFVMMNSLFGHKFKSSYGSAVDDKGKLSMTAKVWRRTLNQVPHIDKVLVDLFSIDSPLMESKEWCPDLREIVQMCKELSVKYVREERYKNQSHLLPRDKPTVVVDEKVRDENRKKVEKLLKSFGKTKEETKW